MSTVTAPRAPAPGPSRQRVPVRPVTAPRVARSEWVKLRSLRSTRITLLVAFVLVEWRSPHPLVPLALFANRRFSAANAVTLLVYAGLGVFFFLLVLQLQIVAGFSPLVAGTALLPVTGLMLLLSARSGALAERMPVRFEVRKDARTARVERVGL